VQINHVKTEQPVIMLAVHTFAIVEQVVIILVKTATQLYQHQIQVGISFSFNLNTIFFFTYFPVDCSPGYSVSSGSNQNPTVCMCPDGTLTPNSCSSK